ncbi:class I SAM-dependent methyltransferase [Stieleria sp. ICT_E10.1]|nr:class I SAM-dependent methyltransferase [Stieleria sedimenti]MCS7467546.1 class I SAM-dependent methyltransferase [Stieleria sedimenti]
MISPAQLCLMRVAICFMLAATFSGVLMVYPACVAQDAAVEQSSPSSNEAPQTSDEKPNEQARKSYLGRVVAQPMSHLGASWLVRPERDEEESASESFQKLDLKPGMVLCDLGCGNGYWTLPMARKVGPEGAVYAVDIQPEMLQKLRQRADQFGLKNIRPVLGTIDNPKIPENKIDLLLMVDVYHEFSHPQSMLWEIRRSLTPTGVVALLEYRKEDPTVPIKLLHKMSKRQIMKEYHANGFKLVREYNELPWQHLMFFARDDSPLEAIQPEPTEQVLQRIGPAQER